MANLSGTDFLYIAGSLTHPSYNFTYCVYIIASNTFSFAGPTSTLSEIFDLKYWSPEFAFTVYKNNNSEIELLMSRQSLNTTHSFWHHNIT